MQVVVVVLIVAAVVAIRWYASRQSQIAFGGVEFVVDATPNAVANAITSAYHGKGAASFFRGARTVKVDNASTTDMSSGAMTIGFHTEVGDRGSIELVPVEVRGQVSTTVNVSAKSLYRGAKAGAEGFTRTGQVLSAKLFNICLNAGKIIKFERGLEKVIKKQLVKAV